MKKKLIQMYNEEMFKPSLLGILINPFYIVRKRLLEGILSKKGYLTGRLLDFGCGSKPYESIFSVKEYVGLDIQESGHSHKDESIDVYYDGNTIPFDDNSFDSIFSSEVFEHIPNLEAVIGELFRVLKPGGHMVITVPFVWDEHEIPYDFARYSSFGIRHLLAKAGFEVLELDKTTDYVETVFQMWTAYVSQFVLPKNRVLKLVLTPLFVAPLNILGILSSRILPKNQAFYHNTIAVVKKT